MIYSNFLIRANLYSQSLFTGIITCVVGWKRVRTHSYTFLH